MAGPERLLELVGTGQEGDARERGVVFLRFLLLHMTARDAVRFVEGAGDERAAWSLGFAVCLLASFERRWLRAAACGGLLFGSWKLAAIFPDNSNHFFLEYLCLCLASLVCWRRPEDALVFVRGARWLPVLVFFWSGLNKALYGTYFNGAYLGSILPHSGFAAVFSLLMSDQELARLLATGPRGPYAMSSPLALLASNGVWLGEVAAAFLMLSPRWRALGALLGLALLVGIEVGARELMFGALMTNLLGLYAPPAWGRRLFVGSAAFYALLLATAAGLLPGWSFN